MLTDLIDFRELSWTNTFTIIKWISLAICEYIASSYKI